MKLAGIHPSDIVIVDRAETAQHNSNIVAGMDGEFTIKRLYLKGEACCLVPANPRYAPLKITPETDFEVWGVVTYVLHKAV